MLSVIHPKREGFPPPLFTFQQLPENTFPSVPISHFRRIILPQSERKGETRGAFREPAAGIDKHGSGRPYF